MGLRIATNVQSLNARRTLGLTTEKLARHQEKMASGYRINRAADDAAGLAISEKMKAQIRSLNQARRNASDGISLVQTAEGGLNEISNILGRLKELSIQSASDTIGDTERGYLQREFTALKDEIDRIATSAEFNGTHLLAGDPMNLPEGMRRNSNVPPLEIQVGADYILPEDSLESRNPIDIIRVDLRRLNSLTTGEGSLELGHEGVEGETRIDKKAAAQQTISRIDGALEKVSSHRATLGAIQNRLISTTNNLSIQVENIDQAKSRIKDADYAEESAQVAQQSILQQAGVSVLAQANQLPNLALKLLQ